MCRLAAFPPRFPKQSAIDIMKKMLHGNDDGVGTAYLKNNEFIINKFAGCITKALAKEVPLFDHMPYNGWTIAHIRQATHGGNTFENTHPFIKGNYCVVHNGIFHDAEVLRHGLRGFTKFKGETDSEVAAFLINKLGPKAFANDINRGGVYLALNRDGTLHIMKTTGEIEFVEVDDNRGYMFSSEFHDTWHSFSKTLAFGWFHLGKNGFLLTKDESSRGSQSWNSQQSCELYTSPPRRGGTVTPDGANRLSDGQRYGYPPYQHQLGNISHGPEAAVTGKQEVKVQSDRASGYPPDDSSDGPSSRCDTGRSDIIWNKRLWDAEAEGLTD